MYRKWWEQKVFPYDMKIVGWQSQIVSRPVHFAYHSFKSFMKCSGPSDGLRRTVCSRKSSSRKRSFHLLKQGKSLLWARVALCFERKSLAHCVDSHIPQYYTWGAVKYPCLLQVGQYCDKCSFTENHFHHKWGNSASLELSESLLHSFFHLQKVKMKFQVVILLFLLEIRWFIC